MHNQLSSLTPSDLPYDLADLAEVIGMENLVQVVLLMGGACLYIPKLDALSRPGRNRSICEAYAAGTSVRKLARQYGLTERLIYQIIRDGKEGKHDE